MPSPTLTITDQDLLNSLQQSALLPEEKKEFEEMLDTMTDEEKEELRQLIEEANQAKKEFETEKTQKLAELNIATENKLAKVEKEETSRMLIAAEKFDQSQTEKEMMNLEEDIKKNEDAEKKVMIEQGVVQEKTPEPLPKAPHTVRNFILILFVLLMLGSMVIYGLSTL